MSFKKCRFSREIFALVAFAGLLIPARTGIAQPARRFAVSSLSQSSNPDERAFSLTSGPSAPTGGAVVTGRFAPTGQVCPEEPPLENFTTIGQTVSVPGFAQGEEAAVILNAPADHYPIEILKVRIGWSSVGGNGGQSLEDAIRIYPAGLPNPGGFQYEVLGPVLTDGGINEFDLTSVPGKGSRIVNGGPFTVSLRIANTMTPTSPAPIHDGNGCQIGKNAIFASPGIWFDACVLGVSGDWIISVTYRRVNCGGVFPDCNGNGQDDNAEIAANPSLDCNRNGQIDSCEITANPSLDQNNNGIIDSCEPPSPKCASDLNGDGVVNGVDLATILANWGVCAN